MRIAMTCAATDPLPPQLARDAVQGACALTIELPLDEAQFRQFSESGWADRVGACQAGGVTVDWIVACATADGPALIDPEESRRDSAVQMLTAALDLARRLGSDLVEYSPGDVPSRTESGVSPIRYEDAHARLLAALLSIRFHAQDRATRLALRVPGERFMLSPMECRALVDRVNSPWVGLVLDLAAVERIGNPIDWIHTLGHRVVGLVASCPSLSTGASAREPDWEALSRGARDAGFDGLIRCPAGWGIDRVRSLLDSINFVP